MDNFSRHIWLKPLVGESSAEITGHLRKIFQQFGFPHKVQNDQGHEFKGNLKKYPKCNNIKQITSSAYHPQSQGKVERMHHKLKSMSQYDISSKKNTNGQAFCGNMHPFGIKR